MTDGFKTPKCPECGARDSHGRTKTKERVCHICFTEWKPNNKKVSKKKEKVEVVPVSEEKDMPEEVLERKIEEHKEKKRLTLPEGFPEPENESDYIIEPE